MRATAAPSPSRIHRSAWGLLALGAWGALVPFVGPTFGYGMGGTPAWTWTESHATLHLAPGLAAIIGALLMLRGGTQLAQTRGSILAAAGGVWFVIAPALHPLWASQGSGATGGRMSGMGTSTLSSALSSLGYHYGTGVLIALIAGYALGLLTVSQQTREAGAMGRAESGNAGTLAEASLVDAPG